jgi:phosphatidylglycerol lysyltransferase
MLGLSLPRWLPPIVTLILFCGAIYVIHGELSAHSFHDVLHALRGIGPDIIAAAFALVLGSYACLIVSERLALNMIGKQLPFARIWRPTVAAHALGNALGFSFATGPAARARLYKEALSPAEIAAVSALSGAGVFMSAAAVAGAGLLIAAPEIAGHGFGHVWLWRVLGFGLVLPCLTWIIISWRWPRTGAVAGVSVHTPPWTSAMLQTAIGVADWLAAAGLLYVLLPEHGGWSFPAFIAVFVASGMFGGISGAPGGLGVFEASILALAPPDQHAPAALAALLIYRLVYTVLPLGVGALLLGHDTLERVRDTPALRTAQRFSNAASELVPHILAALAFAGGAVLLLSSATPSLVHRLNALTQVAPLFVVELSHFFASVTGVLLLIVAAALWRRLEGAYYAALVLLAAGATFALLRGFDYEEALLLSAIALVLAPCRRAFTRKSSLLREALSPLWIAAILGALIAAGWLGFFAYRDTAYSDELWWTFLRDAQASRFLRGTAGVAIIVVALSLWSLMTPPRMRWRGGPSASDLERAAAIIANGEDTRGDAHLALLGDKTLLFSASGRSFLMFRPRGRHWIAMSEPCGLLSERRELIWRFMELADEADASPAFYSIRANLLADCVDVGLAARKIGETAIVPIPSFSLDGKGRAGLRQTRNRVEREGAVFEILPPGSASGARRAELEAVSQAWLAKHAGAEKAFSLGSFDIAYLDRTPLAVVLKDARIVAFANLWTTSDKRELTIDLMRYGPDAPKSVMDYLFIRLIEWGKELGYQEFDLGMTPLAGLDTHRLAPVFSRVGAAVYEDGERLYGFRGLRAYKQKFDPEWRPLYLAAPPGALMAFALLDVALLTSGGWRGLLDKA